MKKSVAIKFMLQFVCLAAGSAHAAQEMVDCDGCPVMVVIPAGEFMMGSSAEESGHPDEKPVRKIIIKKDFAVSKFEITFDEWARCVGAGGCSDVSDEGWGRGKRPVININFAAAQSYVNWLSKSTQKSYRLLSEAEWEYAARAGTTTAWPWGSHKGRGGVKEACAFSNSHDASSTAARPDFAWLPNPCSDGYAYTAPVGTFKPNAFGLYDMLGNVKEWVK
jgi:formylglycine-generating enzyme required for sulfatase activity